MFGDEFIDGMLTHFTIITNTLISLGKSIDNDQKVWKIIRALPQAWEVNATTLKEIKNRKEMYFTAFMRKLKTQRWR